MNRSMMIVATLWAAAACLHAGPPGVLDGENIPGDFAASKRVGIQTNYTGVGDVTSLESIPVFTDGSELDALYLAKDSTYLYVGLAGNLLEVGSPFVIFIDNPFEFGQTELQTEGVDGPAFLVQLAGREVVVDDNGTPDDGSDDTYTVVPGSGTVLPNCGDPGFTGWDFALAIDAADNATMYAHEYILYGFPIGTASGLDLCHFGDGRVPCDPTPENPNDPALPVYALRNLVASTPLGDGNEIFEGGQPAFGYQRGGFDNSNTAGVTDTDASQATTALTGVEIAIPLANIGDSGLFGSETINLMVVTMDGDEFQTTDVSDGYGTFLNQTLPALSGPSCDPPQTLGLRPNLSVIASCLTIDLGDLGFIGTGAVLEGIIDPADYDTGAPLLVQQCPTSGGDQDQLDDLLVPAQDGSELDALFVDHDDQFVYLGLTGNLQVGDQSINLFVDVDGGAGDHVLSDFNSFELGGTYEQWETATFTSGPTDFRVESTDFGGGWYDLEPNVNARGATTLTLDVTINPANQADVIRVVLTDADGTERFFDFPVPGTGTFELSLPLSAYASEPTPGTLPGLDLSALSFFQLAGGFNNGDPGLPFDVTFDRLAVIDDDAGEHVLDFVPSPDAFTSTDVEDFGTFALVGTYVSWDNATFTNEGGGFRVEATGGFGGGFFDINPNVDLSSEVGVELQVTVNPASAAGGVLLVLADGDDTQLRWSWFGLAPGNSYTLTANIAEGAEVNAGGVPGFDYTNVSFCHLQADFATTDLTFENLAVTGVVRGVAPIYAMNGNALANGPLDVLGNGLFPADTPLQYDRAYGINLSQMPNRAYVDYFDLVSDTYAFRGAVVPASGDSQLFDDPDGPVAENPNGLEMAFNNWNTTGVIGCASDLPCFQDDAQTVAALAELATTGAELAIPLADLGLTPADLPRIIHVWTVIGSRQGSAANQSLPSMRNASFEGNQVVNPGEPPVDFTAPESGPDAGAVLSDFSNFLPSGQYGVWDPADYTAGPDTFRVQSSDWGGCYFFLDPNIDAGGATDLVLDVTLNPNNATDRVVVVLVDADGTTRVWRWDNLANGTYSLTKPLGSFVSEDNPGAIPGLDLSALAQFNIAGAFHHGNPGIALDITFDNLALVGGLRNFEARAARICLGTIPGDGDCDGDNDVVDVALLQQCFGSFSDPIFPMECEQLDLVKDGVIDGLDFDAFTGLVTGP
jgi:hypothetical protein